MIGSKFISHSVRIPVNRNWMIPAYLSLRPSSTRNILCLRRLQIISGKDHSQKRAASTGANPPSQILRGIKRVFYTTVGVTLLGIGGVVVYAKQDNKFRATLESYVPGSDKIIGVLYQESGVFEEIEDKVFQAPNELYKQVTEALEGVTKSTQDSTQQSPSISIKPASPPSQKTSPQKSSEGRTTTVNVSNPEVSILKIGGEAVSLYRKAIKLLEGKQNKIPDLIDKAVENDDVKLWNEIKKQIAEQNNTTEEIINIENKAKALFDQYSAEKKNVISRLKLNDDTIKQMNDTEEQLNKLIKQFKSIKALNIEGPKNYFNKIEDSRKRLLEELTILFPNIRFSESPLKLKEDELDLFLYYAVQKLNYYQKEIAKSEAQALGKLKKLIEGDPSLQNAIDGEVSKARRKIKEDFDNKVLDLKSASDKQLHEQMKRQEQVHLDLLTEQLKLKEKEVERKLLHQLEAKIEEEQSRLMQELAEMTTRMQALNEAIAKRALQDMKAQTSQALWSASEDLYSNLKRSTEAKPKPLAAIMNAIKTAAAKGDDLVETVLASIPTTARDRGVYSEEALRDRFLTLEKVAWRVADIPEGGASLPRVFLAWVQSALVIRAAEPMPSNELKNEPIDPCSLNNYDILQRARYWVDRGDFEQALRYMNLLKGGAKSVALEWMKEVTLLLEAQQAAKLLLAHASSSGMIYS